MSEETGTSGDAVQTEANTEATPTTQEMTGDAAAVAATLQDNAPVQTNDAQSVAEAVGATEEGQATWNFAEDIPGKGDVPEWFKADKYKTVADQAKAYKDLESKFGTFTGAPDEYADVTLNENLAEMGIEIDKEDGLYQEAMKFAKESNMNQEGFDKIVNLYAMEKAAEQQAFTDYREEQLKALGTNGETRINNLNAWANANLSPEMVEGLQEMATSASAIQTIEHLIAKSRPAAVSPGGAQPVGGITESELREMQFAKDEHGGRKIQSDPDHRAKYEAAMNQFYGTENHQIIVGG